MNPALFIIIGLLYLVFALPKDKVQLMESRPLSEVWYPALLSTRMATVIATDLSTQNPAKAKAQWRKMQRNKKRKGRQLLRQENSPPVEMCATAGIGKMTNQM